jgi:hypothetical protein
MLEFLSSEIIFIGIVTLSSCGLGVTPTIEESSGSQPLPNNQASGVPQSQEKGRNINVQFPTSLGVPPSDVIEQVAWAGTGCAGDLCVPPTCSQYCVTYENGNEIHLQKFLPNQKLKIDFYNDVSYDDRSGYTTANFVFEINVQADSSGNLVLSFDVNLSNIPIWIVRDENGNWLFENMRGLEDAKDIIISSACNGSLKSRISVGMDSRVTKTDGTPLRIRTQPNKETGTIITSLAEGLRMKIMEGPECNDGWVWWRVETENGINGWVAEGDQSIWFIEPIN